MIQFIVPPIRTIDVSSLDDLLRTSVSLRVDNPLLLGQCDDSLMIDSIGLIYDDMIQFDVLDDKIPGKCLSLGSSPEKSSREWMPRVA
jgi:hypothetical protein